VVPRPVQRRLHENRLKSDEKITDWTFSHERKANDSSLAETESEMEESCIDSDSSDEEFAFKKEKRKRILEEEEPYKYSAKKNILFNFSLITKFFFFFFFFVQKKGISKETQKVEFQRKSFV
jgi:hypothetical protein